MPQETLIFRTSTRGNQRMAIARGLNRAEDALVLTDGKDEIEYPLSEIAEVELAEPVIAEITVGDANNPRGYWVLNYIRPRVEVGPPPENARYRLIGRRAPHLTPPTILVPPNPVVEANAEFLHREIEGAGTKMSIWAMRREMFPQGCSVFDMTVELETGLLRAAGEEVRSSYDSQTQEILHLGISTGIGGGIPGIILAIDGVDKLKGKKSLVIDSEPGMAVTGAAFQYNEDMGINQLPSINDWYFKS